MSTSESQPEHPEQPLRIAKPVTQPHDKAFKLLFGDPVMAREFVEDFVDPEIVEKLDLDTLERLPAEFISETWEQRSDDILYRVRFKDGTPCYLVLMLEFQKDPEYDMVLRILAYCALLLQALAKTEEVKLYGLPPILPIVIYIGDKKWDAAPDVRRMFVSTATRRVLWYCPQQRYLLLNIRELADSAFVGKGIAAQVFRLERSRDVRELREALRDAAQRFHGKQYRNIRRIIADWMQTVVFKRHRIDVDVPEEVYDLEGGFTMLEQRVDRWVEQFIQQGMAQGMAEGEARGETRGIQIGETRGIQIGETRGIQIGEARGRVQGGLNMLFSLVQDGLLSLSAAARKANMTEDEFKAKMLAQEVPKES